MRVEGLKLIVEALDAGLEPKALLVALGAQDRLGDLPELHGVPGGLVEERVLAGVTDTTTDAAALFRVPSPGRVPEQGLVLVLDGVQDPGNVGTLARSALALGAGALVAGAGTARPFSPKVIRASAGAVFRLPILNIADWSTLVAPSDQVLLADAHRGEPPEAVPRNRRTFLVLGNEARGITRHPAGAVWLRIPVRGPVESLNVAAAGAILLYMLGGCRADSASTLPAGPRHC